MINAYGGAEAFYKDFYIHSICPLGFTATNAKGREVNYNYYDSKELSESVHDFIIENIQKQINFGIDTSVGFCLGTGKNEHFLRKLNEKYQFFEKIIALEHPRFVMQYKSRSKQVFVDKYLAALKEAT